MSIRKRKRELLHLARSIFSDATIAQTPGSHLLLTVYGPNGSHKVICTLTPSDHRDAKNIRRDLMSAARIVGVVVPTKAARTPHESELTSTYQ